MILWPKYWYSWTPIERQPFGKINSGPASQVSAEATRFHDYTVILVSSYFQDPGSRATSFRTKSLGIESRVHQACAVRLLYCCSTHQGTTEYNVWGGSRFFEARSALITFILSTLRYQPRSTSKNTCRFSFHLLFPGVGNYQYRIGAWDSRRDVHSSWQSSVV